MNSVIRFEHQFVKSTPRDLSPGVLYVSLEYCTMLHLCACGCNRKVVTPLSPNDWSMTFNGKTITVNPSIGSWSLPCQSHYVIKCSKVVWAAKWSDAQISKGREADLIRKGRRVVREKIDMQIPSNEQELPAIKRSVWQSIFKWVNGKT